MTVQIPKENITNGDFENGETGWNFVSTSLTGVDYHSASNSVLCTYGSPPNSYIEQTFATPIPVDDIIEVSVWAKLGSGIAPKVAFFFEFSDASNEFLYSGNVPATWTKYDFTSALQAVASGKSISSINIDCGAGAGGNKTLYIDDVILTSILLDADIISWEEEQECNPSIRDIPTSDNGAYVDVNTYLLKARILNVTLRLSDGEKDNIETIYGNNALITITATQSGDSDTWELLVWLVDKPFIYEYRSSDSDVKEWRANLRFKVESFSYSGSGYSETDDTITIDGDNYSFVVDTSFSESSEIFEEDFVNQDVDLDTSLWSKSPLTVIYAIRLSSLGKWELDQLLTGHTVINLTDAKYGLNNNVWVKKISAKWEGDANWDYPWLLEITLIRIL